MALTSTYWAAPRVAPFTNPNYLAVISCNDKNITVTANLPQEFAMDVGASYEEAFSQGLSGLLNGGGMISDIAGKSMKMLGLQLTTKALTAQVWQGSTEISFSLPLVFQVESDSEADIQKPLRDLYSLVLPEEKESGGLLEAPGPRVDLERLKQQALNLLETGKKVGSGLSSAYSNNQGNLGGMAQEGQAAVGSGLRSFSNAFLASVKNNISLSIGDRMLFKSVVITSVAQNFSVQPLEDGVFQRVECTVGFKTFYVLTQQDMPDLFSPGAYAYSQKGSSVAPKGSAVLTYTPSMNNPSAYTASPAPAMSNGIPLNNISAYVAPSSPSANNPSAYVAP